MERTHKILKVVIANKVSDIKGLREQGFQSGDLISSQPRYDHFDTSPCIFNRLLGEKAIFN